MVWVPVPASSTTRCTIITAKLEVLVGITEFRIYYIHCGSKKTAPFYFLHNFVKSRSILIIFGAHIPEWICNKDGDKIIHLSYWVLLHYLGKRLALVLGLRLMLVFLTRLQLGGDCHDQTVSSCEEITRKRMSWTQPMLFVFVFDHKPKIIIITHFYSAVRSYKIQRREMILWFLGEISSHRARPVADGMLWHRSVWRRRDG